MHIVWYFIVLHGIASVHIVWGLKKTTNGAPWLQINLAPQFLFRITIIITITIITITAIFITILIVCDNRSSRAYASQPPAETLSNWLLSNHRQLRCHPDHLHHHGHIGITKYLDCLILKYSLTHNESVNSPDKSEEYPQRHCVEVALFLSLSRGGARGVSGPSLAIVC